jgi:hypothetical protein
MKTLLLACLFTLPALAQFSVPSSAPMTAALLKPAAGGGGGSWVPTDVANLVFWVKADGLTASDGDQPDTLTDFSGNNRHFSQSVSGSRALYTNATSGFLNNKPHLWFDGSADFYTNRTWTPSTGNYTFFCVMKQEKYSDFVNRTLFSIDSEMSVFSYQDANHKLRKADSSGNTDGEILESVPYVITMVANSTGTACQLYTNGVAAGSAGVHTPPTTPTYMMIGMRYTLANFFKQALAEMFVYESALGTSDREDAETYLGAKYGITITH